MTSANERMGSWVMAVTVLVTVIVTRHSEGAGHDMMTTSDHLDPEPDVEGSAESEPSEVNTEQPELVTSIDPGSSILIVYEGEDAEGAALAGDGDALADEEAAPRLRGTTICVVMDLDPLRESYRSSMPLPDDLRAAIAPLAP